MVRAMHLKVLKIAYVYISLGELLLLGSSSILVQELRTGNQETL